MAEPLSEHVVCFAIKYLIGRFAAIILKNLYQEEWSEKTFISRSRYLSWWMPRSAASSCASICSLRWMEPRLPFAGSLQYSFSS